MIDTYNIRFYKNNTRIAPKTLSNADARLFYRQLKLFAEHYEGTYGEVLNNDSLLIVIDNKNLYRSRKRMSESGVETVHDLMEYLNFDLANEPKHIFANNMIVYDKSMKLDDIYILQFFTSPTYFLSSQSDRKKRSK